MKKVTLLLIIETILIVSCGKNKEEQMLYDYQQKNAKVLNFDLDDLDFKIISVEKVADIKSSDSMKVLKQKLAVYLKREPKQTLIDTLSFKHVKDILDKLITQQDTLYKGYQKLVLSAIRRGDISSEYKYKSERKKIMKEKLSNQKTLVEIENLEKLYTQLAVNPDSILASKFRVKYSQKNPLLGNAKQTFEKIFYTNSQQTEFVKSESVEKD